MKTFSKRRAAGLVLCGSVLLSVVTPAPAAQPLRAIISTPENARIFKPGETISVAGTATAPQGLVAVKLEYWLLNSIKRKVLATCSGCGSTAASWNDAPTDLSPGYYVVKAYAVDVLGSMSEPATRSFAAGVQSVPVPPVNPPSTPKIENPIAKDLVPGSGGSVPISGVAKPGSTVRVWERNLGPLGTVRTDGQGRWTYAARLPSGAYQIGVQTIDAQGRAGTLSKLVGFTVDAERPLLDIETPDGSVFTALQPVKLSGTLFDERRAAAVVLEYWLLDRLMLADLARCVGCGQQEAVWQHAPKLAYPGYYHVKVKAFDRAGNPSWTQVVTFIVV